MNRVSVGSRCARVAAAWASLVIGWLGDETLVLTAATPVIADSGDGQPIALPSVAAELDSFDAVAGAMTEDRKRVAALEDRLRRLEEKATPETLPSPSAKEIAGAGATAKQPDIAKPDTAKKEDTKPAEPYEVGSDKNFKTAWKDAFQAESAQKDFRVKIGGRSQVDAVGFTAGPGPNQSPDQGGLDPSLSDTVELRRARFRIEGRMYEMYDWACEYDFVNQINVNNSLFPTERDAGPLTAVTDLWLQVRQIRSWAPCAWATRKILTATSTSRAAGGSTSWSGRSHRMHSKGLSTTDSFRASRSSTATRKVPLAGRWASSRTRRTRSAFQTLRAAA